MATYTKLCTGAGSGYGFNPYTLRLVLTETNVDVINNQSTVKYDLYLDSDYARFEDWSCTYSMTATGVTGNMFNETKQRSMPTTRGESLLLKSGTVKTYTHDSTGAYSISFKASFTASSGQYDPGDATISDTFKLTDINRVAPTITLADISDITANSFKISASANANCDMWEYTLDEGRSWSSLSTSSGSSAGKTITGLTAGVTYTVQVRARRTYNHLSGTSSAKSAMTLGKSIIGTVAPFNLEDVFRVPLTKYVSSATDTLTIKVGGALIKTVTGYTSNRDIQLTNDEILTAYNALGSSNTATAALTLETKYNGASLGNSSTTATATAAGTAKARVGGVYKRGVVWRRSNGTWKRAIVYVKASGSWKRGV